MTDILEEKEPRNIQNEILLVGSFYKNRNNKRSLWIGQRGCTRCLATHGRAQ